MQPRSLSDRAPPEPEWAERQDYGCNKHAEDADDRLRAKAVHRR